MEVLLSLIGFGNPQPLLLEDALSELIGQEFLADVNAAALPMLSLVDGIGPVGDRRRAHGLGEPSAHR